MVYVFSSLTMTMWCVEKHTECLKCKKNVRNGVHESLKTIFFLTTKKVEFLLSKTNYFHKHCFFLSYYNKSRSKAMAACPFSI